MSATHYTSSSKGPVSIATMNYNHAINARDKLARELGADDHPRRPELDALNARVAEIEAMADDEVQS